MGRCPRRRERLVAATLAVGIPTSYLVGIADKWWATVAHCHAALTARVCNACAAGKDTQGSQDTQGIRTPSSPEAQQARQVGPGRSGALGA